MWSNRTKFQLLFVLKVVEVSSTNQPTKLLNLSFGIYTFSIYIPRDWYEPKLLIHEDGRCCFLSCSLPVHIYCLKGHKCTYDTRMTRNACVWFLLETCIWCKIQSNLLLINFSYSLFFSLSLCVVCCIVGISHDKMIQNFSDEKDMKIHTWIQ